MNNFFIKQMQVGPMENFIYFIGDKTTNEVVVMDPAWDVNFLIDETKKNNLIIKAALLTHGHFDHTNGVEELLKHFDIPVYINKHEVDFFKLNSGKENLKEVESGEKLKVGNIEICFVHTPGHTPGSQCFLIQNNLISGDTLFIDGCGRCDLPGGDVNQMFDTIYNKLMKMRDDTIIFPGHNYAKKKYDSLLNQKKTNPYMQYDNLMTFIGKRLPT
ncbi:MAG: MBL fold metallo-hydrolase [Candidatus Melainabacteria bacterium]|nr:MBL fold metallo-hydrolase [Candidatus Melainabacteria bacterium]